MSKEEIKKMIERLKDEKEMLEAGDNEQEYKEMLNETNPSFKIGYLEYFAGDILKEVDPIAFNEGLNNYNDERLTNIEQEIEDLKQELKELEEITK